MLSLLLRGQFAHTRTGGELQELTLSRQGRSVTVLALRDTGNTLQDPVTGRPVVVIEGEKLQTLVPELPVLDRQSLSHPVDLLRDLEGDGGATCASSCCPIGRWGWSAVCSWPCGWTGPTAAAGKSGTASPPSLPPRCRTAGGYSALIGGERGVNTQ